MLTLIQNVDPHAWLMTLPLVLGMLWVRSQPPRHVLKRLWCELMQADAMAMASLGVDVELYEQRQRVARRAIYWGVIAALLLATALSMGIYVGVL